MRAEILCVDDQRDITTVVRASLTAAGYEVRVAHSAAEALTLLERHGLPSLAIIDIRMPETTGLELCSAIHRFCDLPVILLTAVDDEPTVVQALNEVAEDYVIKPFRPAVLVARVQRVLRRLGNTESHGRLLQIDERLQVDFVRQVAEVDNRQITLTPTETKVLHVLSRRIGKTVRLEFLLRRIWPIEEVFEDTLRVHMHRLRKKLEPDPEQPRYLFTERGVGYRLGGERAS